MKFNGITTGGGGSAATELTDWATRLEGTYSEGDLAVWTATGATYRWCSAFRGGSGDWVRSEAYTSSFEDLAYIDGTEASQAQALAQGWDSINVGGAGTVTFDGTHTLMYANGGGTGDYAQYDLLASCPINITSSFYTSGLYTMETIHNTGNRLQYLGRVRSFTAPGSSNSYSHYLLSNSAVPNVNSIDAANPVYGTNSDGEFNTTTGEIHIAFEGKPNFSVNNQGIQRVWLNHAKNPYIAGLRAYTTVAFPANLRIYTRASDMKVRAFSSGYIS